MPLCWSLSIGRARIIRPCLLPLLIRVCFVLPTHTLPTSLTWRLIRTNAQSSVIRSAIGSPSQTASGALAQLRQGYVLGALTNMDDASFAKSHALLDGCFEFVVTAERAGAYKPSLRHFVLGLTDLAERKIPPHRVLHVAQSLRADVRPANLLGQDVVWINREGRGLGHTGFGAELAVPMASFPTMDSFVSEFLD